ncbi:HD domain-containing protein [Gimesia algae]|uniref:Deoxyguanosinetriphosphate triphosphohydrolase-like protein n=1 Tax=Gimesia algae TaxID=2527971 RepID=A0A517VGE7_9PLAN|nr:HD domain-containing protein [Gimesia algae]QDT92096.1 Deoxyguanosinetriphosphate triphosphohydrolase-like protein [Gimesia algae]
MNHPYVEIPELSSLQSGSGLVRIPYQQDVPFTKRVRALVDTAEFRRLSHITQLGFTALVYPGATHTRFEHALGVYQNALQYLWQLGKDPRFTATINVHTAEVLIAAALLHDLGHWPFCHLIEDMSLEGIPRHEAFAKEFLSDARELAEILRSEWGIEPAEVLDILVPSSDTPEMRLVRSILSGPIDIDKMDYLDRDSLHAGVPYGRNFDKNRLIHSLMVNAAGDGLAIGSKGKTAAELMVFARYVMFSEVYWHHAVRSASTMFARAFYHLYPHLDLSSYFQLTEADSITVLRAQARGTECERLVEGVFSTKRLLYKRVAEFSYYESSEVFELIAHQPVSSLVRWSENLAKRLTKKFHQPVASTDILIDAPPTHREVEFNVEIYSSREAKYQPLHVVSPVVDTLARKQFDDFVKRVRVFAHPDIARLCVEMDDFENMLIASVAE